MWYGITHFRVSLGNPVAFQETMDLSKTAFSRVALKEMSLLGAEVVPYGSTIMKGEVFSKTSSTFDKGQRLLIIFLFISDGSKHLQRFQFCPTLMKSYLNDPASMPLCFRVGRSTDMGINCRRLGKWTVPSCSQISARGLWSSGY